MNLKNIKGTVLLTYSSTYRGRGKPTKCLAGRPAPQWAPGTQPARQRGALWAVRALQQEGAAVWCGTCPPGRPHQVWWDFYLVSLFTSRNWAGKRLLFPSVHAHGAEDGFGADGALRGPGLVAVRLLVVHLLLIVFAACRGTESKGCQGQSPPAGVLWPPRGQEEPVAGWAAAPARERAFRAQRACKHVWSLGQAWWEDTCSPT